MSDLCLYEFEDIAWDELCGTDDHIVPHTGSEQADHQSISGDSLKKPRHEPTSVRNSTRYKSNSEYDDQGREEGQYSSLNRRKCTMLEKDTRSRKQSDVFPSLSNNDSIKETSSLTSENATSLSHAVKSNTIVMNGNKLCENDTGLDEKGNAAGSNSLSYPLGDIIHTGNNLNFFENNQDKDSGDFLYYGWPEIGNFEDVDRMFSGCDSTFGLGASKEDELDWLSPEANIGGSEDVVSSAFKFPCPESNPEENISRGNDSLKSYNESAMTNEPIRYKDNSWLAEGSESYISFANEPSMGNVKDGFIPKKQINEHNKMAKLQNQSTGKRKEHFSSNRSFSHMSNLHNEVLPHPSGATSHQAFPSVHMQQQQHASGPDSCNYLKSPALYVDSNNSSLSNQTSVNSAPSAVKAETKDLTSPSPRGSGKREKLHNSQSSQSLNSSLENANATVQAATVTPGSTGKQVQYSEDKSENLSGIEGVSHFNPAELGSSNIQESSTMSSGMDDISLEAASFLQLQHVMEQLDLRTRICIRDSLYRLARSAEQRHNHANMNAGCGDERDAGGAFLAEGTNNCTSFMDIETDTNPIDRSIAHLLFHRPSESSTIPAHDSSPFKTVGAVHRSTTILPVMVENTAIGTSIQDLKLDGYGAAVKYEEMK